MSDSPLNRTGQAWHRFKQMARQIYHAVLSFLRMIARPFVWVARLPRRIYHMARGAGRAARAAYHRFIVSPIRWIWHAAVSVVSAPRNFYRRFVVRPYIRVQRWLRHLGASARHTASTTTHFFRVTARGTAGWSCIVVGLILTPLPLPLGLPLTVAGVILVGPNNPYIRRARFYLKSSLRKMSRRHIPALSQLAQNVLTLEKRFAQRWKKQVEAHTNPSSSPEAAMEEEIAEAEMDKQKAEEETDQLSRS